MWVRVKHFSGVIKKRGPRPFGGKTTLWALSEEEIFSLQDICPGAARTPLQAMYISTTVTLEQQGKTCFLNQTGGTGEGVELR
jgi:hypothetical protein